jgi:hypothetical protein
MYFVLAAEARRVGLPFGGHVMAPLTPLEASDSGASILDHIMGMETLCLNRSWVPDWNPSQSALSSQPDENPSSRLERCRKVAEQFRHNGTWWAPTLTVYTEIIGKWDSPRTRPIVQRFRELADAFWSDSLSRYASSSFAGVVFGRAVGPASGPDSTADSLGALYDAGRAGVPILAGTDSQIFPGLALHTELALLVAEGLTPLEALRAATLNPAQMLRATDSLGTVAPGKLADLVLLDADPLADITNTTTIRAVVANGRYFDRTALDGLLAEVRARPRP